MQLVVVSTRSLQARSSLPLSRTIRGVADASEIDKSFTIREGVVYRRRAGFPGRPEGTPGPATTRGNRVHACTIERRRGVGRGRGPGCGLGAECRSDCTD